MLTQHAMAMYAPTRLREDFDKCSTPALDICKGWWMILSVHIHDHATICSTVPRQLIVKRWVDDVRGQADFGYVYSSHPFEEGARKIWTFSHFDFQMYRRGKTAYADVDNLLIITIAPGESRPHH